MAFNNAIATIGTIFTIGSIVGGLAFFFIVGPGKSPQRKQIFIIALIIAMALSLVIGTALVFSGIPISTVLPGTVTNQPTATTQPTRATSSSNVTGTVLPSVTPSGTQGKLAPLTPQEVQSWCYTIPNGGTCDISRFVQFHRADGTVLPYAVQMLTGEPVGIKLPAGFTAYVWDCYHGKTVSISLDLKSVCTMTVARGTQVPD